MEQFIVKQLNISCKIMYLFRGIFLLLLLYNLSLESFAMLQPFLDSWMHKEPSISCRQVVMTIQVAETILGVAIVGSIVGSIFHTVDSIVGPKWEPEHIGNSMCFEEFTKKFSGFPKTVIGFSP